MARVTSVTGLIACSRKNATTSTNNSVEHGMTIRRTRRLIELRLAGLYSFIAPMLCLPSHTLILSLTPMHGSARKGNFCELCLDGSLGKMNRVWSPLCGGTRGGGELEMAREPVRIAAMAAGVGFLGFAAFQGALALGAPLGAPLGGAAWGGVYDGQLPMGLRIASGFAVGVYVLAALIVVGRGGFRVVPLPYGVLRWGTWVLVGLMFLGALPNFASSSGWERFGLGPLALILGVLCLFVALRAGATSGGG